MENFGFLYQNLKNIVKNILKITIQNRYVLVKEILYFLLKIAVAKYTHFYGELHF